MPGQGGSPKPAASLAQNRPLDGSAGQGPDAARWWRGASVYQVYIRSFCDSNGDGQGDLPGVLSKLDYIAALGVDAIWLSPLHPSPNRDWGYDVSDYDGVQPDYGTLDDFQALVEAAHARGLRIILDEVLAHTSDEHAWFAASRDGDAGKKTWYVWADPKDDGTVPNNWLSVFGGPAWAYQPARRQYYHHKFLRQQPKLNWTDPAARAAALDVLDTWMLRGVDGFRLDVANAFLHDVKLRDNPRVPAGERDAQAWSAAANLQRHLHDSNLEENKALLDIVRRRVERFNSSEHSPGSPQREAREGVVPVAALAMRRAEGGEKFVFGEFSEEFERSGCYLPPDKGLHAGYNFALLLATGAEAIRDHLRTLARHPAHWPCISFSNHDVIRTVSRFGGGADGDPAIAKLYLALLLAMRGTILMYQGEELGLPEVELSRHQLRDPVGDLYYPLFRGRDGCRTPMPWDGTAPNLGFTSGTPWLPLGRAHAALGVAAQAADPASALAYARTLLAARRTSVALRLGELDLIEAPLPVIAFQREAEGERLVCVFNLGLEPVRFSCPLLAQAEPLDWGCGRAAFSPNGLNLGPLSAWFGRLQG